MSSWSVSLAQVDWVQARWGAACGRVPALILSLALGVALHEPAAGVLAAGTSLSVGLAATRRVAGSRPEAMLITTGLMALSAWAGTLTGSSPGLNLLATAVWGLACGFFTIHDEDSGWIVMQGVIALVIASAFPSHDYAALERSCAVLAGGLMQTGIFALLERVHPFYSLEPKPDAAAEKSPIPPRFQWAEFLGSFNLFSAAWRYAARVALTMMLAVEAARLLPMQNGYWLPMTTIIILKPDFYRTYSGAVQRVAGTILGVVVASLIAHLFHPSLGWLVGFVALFSYACFALFKVNTTLFCALLTAYVVFLIAITGLPETTITWHRLILTALGSALALTSRFIGYRTILTLVGARPKD